MIPNTMKRENKRTTRNTPNYRTSLGRLAWKISKYAVKGDDPLVYLSPEDWEPLVDGLYFPQRNSQQSRFDGT